MFLLYTVLQCYKLMYQPLVPFEEVCPYNVYQESTKFSYSTDVCLLWYFHQSQSKYISGIKWILLVLDKHYTNFCTEYGMY